MADSRVSSSTYVAASFQKCRWLALPASTGVAGEHECIDLPCVLGGWSEGAKQHILSIGKARRHADTPELLGYDSRLNVAHPGTVTDLQAARVDDTIIAASCTSSGSICLLIMRLPAVASLAVDDLEFVAAASSDDIDDAAQRDASSYLHELPGMHEGLVMSVDINTTRQLLLSVSDDGGICIIPLDAGAQLSGGEATFKAATGWSGYSQGRWVDSNTFATAGVLGRVEVWDVRAGPNPVSSSPLVWGHTGCGDMDKQQGPARQLLCLDVHPSRPNLAATGASGGSVALWDLRFQTAPLAYTAAAQPPAASASGDVWEVRFDSGNIGSSSAAAVPPLLYCTADGALCCATTGTAAAKQAAVNGWGQGTQRSSSQLMSEVLYQDRCSINSLDTQASDGQDILAVTDRESVLLLHRPVAA